MCIRDRPSAGATIVDGNYQVLPGKGPFAGDFRVEIRAIRETSKKSRDPVTGEILEGGVEQFLPTKYNRDSELTAKISLDQKQYDFALELDGKK